jgi:pimeloyl-ACP methyl ester carboxylesterase
MQDWLPNTENFVLPSAAHGLMMQNPSGMAEQLAAFLKRHPID